MAIPAFNSLTALATVAILADMKHVPTKRREPAPPDPQLTPRPEALARREKRKLRKDRNRK